jgi:hypothetical protein
VKPHVIVTFEPHGGYYHPDHLAIQRATTAAFFSSSVLGSEAPERLFYATILRDVFQGLANASRGRGITDGLDPDVFATAPEMVAVSFDASRFCARRAPIGVRRHAGDAEESAARRCRMLQAFRPVLEREVFTLGGRVVPCSDGRCRTSSTGWKPRRSVDRNRMRRSGLQRQHRRSECSLAVVETGASGTRDYASDRARWPRRSRRRPTR